MKRLNGIHIAHLKNTADMQTVKFPIPKIATIPMTQNMGAVCEPLVVVGDTVFVGQKIGDSDAFVSAPIHASVSGKVVAISDFLQPNGRVCKAVVIESDGLQTILPDTMPPDISDKQKFLKAVRESGVCGLGGAGFPTHVKLSFDATKTPIDTLIINAAECEPYITSDYRELIEHPSDVLTGIIILMEKLDIPYAKLCIEKNKPDAINKFKEMTREHPNLEVVTLPSEYPQGAEKMLVYSATGRIIKEGELPLNHRVLVMNVSTTSFIARYARIGIPLISRRVTVDGNAVKKPCNIRVAIGTPIIDILKFVDAKGYEKVLCGGPMMGTAVFDVSYPVTKVNNALLAIKDVKNPTPTACIRCGQCIRACPMNLMPTDIEKAFDNKDIEELKSLKVMLCMNCGCCTYVCPASRKLAEKNQLAKDSISRGR